METVHKALYFFLFVILALSILAFVLFSLWGNVMFWRAYSIVYLCLLLLSTWYFYLLLFLGDLKPRVFSRYKGERIAVIVPCYNEDPDLFRKSIESLVAAKGNKQIIIINDGSTNHISKLLLELKLKHKDLITVRAFPKNLGKRHALHYAVSNVVANCEYVVTIDSDTLLDEDALVRVVEPLKSKRIGAATGDVRILNEKATWLSRMQASYYWVGLNIYKKAQSVLGIVVCCSGCLAAYKTAVLIEIIDNFVKQEFFGERCTHSEDRHLTNLVLEKGFDVVYVPEAVSHTNVPSTVWAFLRQQQRWKRGYVRESIYTLGYAWKNNKILFLETLFWDLTVPFLTFGLWISVVVTFFTNFPFFLFFILPSWILSMIVRNILVFSHATDKIGGLFSYAAFHDVFLYAMNIYALFTVKNKSWITR